jgi:hypothetical protein
MSVMTILSQPLLQHARPAKIQFLTQATLAFGACGQWLSQPIEIELAALK